MGGKMDAEYWREYRAKRKAAKQSVQSPQGIPQSAKPILPTSALPALPARVPRPRELNLPEPRKHRVLAPPAPRTEYELAKTMLADGESFSAVRRATGQGWLALDEAAHAYADYDAWQDAKDRHKVSMAARIAGAAADAGINGVRRKTTRKTDDQGRTEETVTEECGTDAALLRVAGEYTDPERHGRLAGKTDVSVVVPVQVQILSNAPEPAPLPDEIRRIKEARRIGG